MPVQPIDARAMAAPAVALILALLGPASRPARAQSAPAPEWSPVSGEGGDPPRELAAVERDPRAGPAHWQIGAALAGSTYSILFGARGEPIHGNEGSVALAPRVFLSPVLDDAAPYSLQPFLQRTSSIEATVAAGGFSTRYPGRRTRAQARVGLGASTNLYVMRELAVTSEAGYGYSVLDDDEVERTHSFYGGAGFGVRLGDARVDVGYTLDGRTTNGRLPDQRWGTIELAVHAVIARSFGLDVWGRVFEPGGGGGFQLAHYATKSFALLGGASGETFVYDSSDVRAVEWGGRAGVEYWITPAVELRWTYDLTFRHLDVPGDVPVDEVVHELGLGLVVRPR